MTNPNDPAFLTKPEVWYDRLPKDNSVDIRSGLTKREYFAAMAMQGQLASMTNAEVVKAFMAHGNPWEWCANSAVKFADALIAELNK